MFLLFIFGIRGKACRRYSRNVVLIDNGVDGNGKVIVLSSLKFGLMGGSGIRSIA